MRADKEEKRDGAEPHVSAGRQSRILVATVGSTLLAQMPPFLLGGVAVFAAEDIEMTELGVGAAVSVFFLASLATALYGGRWVQLLGPRKGIYLGAVLGTTAMVAIAALVHSWPQLAVAMFVAGVANALAQPASNLALARGISGRWQGMAFGIKQSAVPMVSLLAGASIPLVALTVGWRWAFVGGAVLAVLLILTLPKKFDRSAVQRKVASVRVARGALRYFAIFGCLATMATTAVGTFMVGSLIDRGETAPTAGVLLAVGSLAAIGSRLSLGWCVDRRNSGHLDLTLISASMWVGALGFVLMALCPAGPLLWVGAVLACMGASGWQGLFHYAVVRRSEIPASATGVTQSGMFAGGALGAPLFSLVSSSLTLPVAWLCLTATAAAASAVLHRHRFSLPLVGAK